MNIVSICACTVGIAHTYIAAEKLEKAAEKKGHNIKIETQGTIVLRMNCHQKILNKLISCYLL